MPRDHTIRIVSDIHFAGAAELAREDYEAGIIGNPLLRLGVRAYRDFIWLRAPFRHNDLLDQVLEAPGAPDWVVANGDYSCDSAFVGVSDPAARASALECLGRLRARFPENLRLVIGDHELGKTSLVGGAGGMRLTSWDYTVGDLALKPFWHAEVGRYVLLGVTSSLLALPVYEPDTLAPERPAWQELRAAHVAEIAGAFRALRPEQRVLLFCHDPSALPFLWNETAVREKIGQVERTIIGHLHSRSVLNFSRVLSGMPAVGFLGNTVRRLSTALREARAWRPFRVLLCPSLTGVELFKDGGFYTAHVDLDARRPAQFEFHPIRR